MRNKTKDMLGKKFNNLTVIGTLQPQKRKDGHGTRPMVLCKCDCGRILSTNATRVKRGVTASCGCLRGKGNLTHGETINGKHSKEYKAWCAIRDRCYNKNAGNYERYGARGITVSDEWLSGFEIFLKDMGRAPTKEHSIDRIDNNNGYYKENCRWATREEQGRNKRNNVKFNGECVTEAAERMGITSATIRARIKRGWSMSLAFNTPLLK